VWGLGLSWSPAGARVWVAPLASAEQLASRPLGGWASTRASELERPTDLSDSPLSIQTWEAFLR
jgi:hypothetical protein